MKKYWSSLLEWSLPPTLAILVVAALYLRQPVIDAATEYEVNKMADKYAAWEVEKQETLQLLSKMTGKPIP